MKRECSGTSRPGRGLIAGASVLVILASTAIGADCWTSVGKQICCKTINKSCKTQNGERWWCPQTSTVPGGFFVTAVKPVAKNIKGKKGVGNPEFVGECTITMTSCGENYGECIVTGTKTVQCHSTNVEGDDCRGD